MLAGFGVIVSSGLTLVVRRLLLVHSMISHPATDILPSLHRDRDSSARRGGSGSPTIWLATSSYVDLSRARALRNIRI